MAKKHFQFLSSELDTAFSMNLFVCVVTYIFILVYCVCYGESSTNTTGIPGVQAFINKLQFYFDAFFPSTLTLCVSMIIQVYAQFPKRDVLTLLLIPAIIIYAMLCFYYHQIDGIIIFLVLMFFSALMVVFCFYCTLHVQQKTGTSPPPGLGVSP